MQITYFGIKPDCLIKIRHFNGNITYLEHRIVRHSQTGFQWGYGGAGPADLALNILLDYCIRTHRKKEIAERFYQDFKWDFLAKADDKLKIEGNKIENWLINKSQEHDSLLFEHPPHLKSQ